MYTMVLYKGKHKQAQSKNIPINRFYWPQICMLIFTRPMTMLKPSNM